MVGYLVVDVRRISADTVLARNFYGALQLEERRRGNDRALVLCHGSTTHGFQLLVPGLLREPTSYYGRQSGIGRALGEATSDPRSAWGSSG